MIPTEQLYLPSVVRTVKIPGRGRGRPPGSGRMAGKNENAVAVSDHLSHMEGIRHSSEFHFVL